MRDFRDAKVMARTLRAALAAKGLRITNSQSLEFIAEMFGAADWNTLAAAIHREADIAHKSTTQSPLSSAEGNPVLPFSAKFAMTQRRALDYARQRKHEYATLEHFLVALIEDADAATVMKVCNADFGELRKNLVSYLDNDLKRLVVDTGGEPKPTAAFHRVVQRAGLQAQDLGRPMVTGANALLALFSETASPAARLLDEQGMSRRDVANIVTQNTGKGTGDTQI
jgi:hypothetical protein